MKTEKAKRDVLQESMRMLGRKDFSRSGMRDALLRKGYLESEACLAVDQLVEWGYLTDERFAEERIGHYQRFGKGRLFVEHYLIEQSVPQEKVRELLERFYPEDEELNIAQKLTSSYFKQRENSPAEHLRWMRRLIASGFSRNAIKACGYRDEET
jgi:SOS response regulatory protein OraA/RecX